MNETDPKYLTLIAIVIFQSDRYKMLEIEIDAIYERLLLLKKKKYAGVKWGGELELKGVDLVRRDWSVLAKKVGTKVLNMLLRPAADEDKEATLEKIHEYMEEVGKRVRLAPGKEDAFPLECFVIRKGLTKDPAQYVITISLSLSFNHDHIPGISKYKGK